ncbi:hypothetical protein Emed_001739 [Eimeria media]
MAPRVGSQLPLSIFSALLLFLLTGPVASASVDDNNATALGYPWLAETLTETASTSWASDLHAGEWLAAEPDKVRYENAPSSEALPNDITKAFPQNKRKRRISIAIRSVLAAALVLCVGRVLLSRVQEEKHLRQLPQTPTLQPDWLAVLTKELDQVKRLSAAADKLHMLLDGSSLDELAAIIRQRVEAVCKDYSLLQKQSFQTTPDEALVKKARRRFRHDVEAFTDTADQVMSHAKIAIKQLAERVDSETKRLQEEAQFTKHVAATIYRDAATVHSELGERIAADAEANMQMLRSLAEAAEKEADASPENIEEAVTRLERTVSQATRMQQLARRTAKDVQEVVWWKKFATDLPLASMQMEGVNLRNKLRGLVEDLSTSNLSINAVSAALKEWKNLQELTRIFGEAPNSADLQNQNDPGALSQTVTRLREASQEAQQIADRAWQVIRGELMQHGPVTDATTYCGDVLAVEAFQNQAIYQGWLATEYTSFVETFVESDPAEVSNLHEQAKAFFEHAKQSAIKVEMHARKTVKEARLAEQKATVPDVLQHLREARNSQEMACLDCMKAYKSSLTFSAWKRLSATAEEALNEAVRTVQTIVAANTSDARNADVCEKVEEMQQQCNAVMEKFKKAKGLKAATQHALKLRQIARELFVIGQEHSMTK